MSATRTVLLTAFGPFPGVPTNASGLLLGRLAPRARRRWPDVRFATATLPTEWERGPARLAALLDRFEPAIAIHFGVSSRATGLDIETTARNSCALSPDARDLLPASLVNIEGGPVARAATLPVALILERLAERAIPARASDDAGDYLCNAILYRSLAWSERVTTARTGFVHIPSSLVGGGVDWRDPPAGCPLDWRQAVDGAMIVVDAALG